MTKESEIKEIRQRIKQLELDVLTIKNWLTDFIQSNGGIVTKTEISEPKW